MKKSTAKITEARIKKYLAEGKRFDGRGLEEFRDLKIELGVSKKAEGSARVKLGDTEVLAGVKMSVGTPYDDSPDKGNFMVTAELLPMSSPRFEVGPPKFEAIELGRVIDRGLRESDFIEFEKLCIKKGEKVWTLFVDIYVMNDDGNLLDAAGIAAVAALKTAKIPKYDEETEKVLYGEWTDNPVPLTKEFPIAITAHKIGEHLIVDPTREEEDVSETRLTVGSSHGSISSMQKGEAMTLSVEEAGKALDLAEKVWKDIFKKIEAQIK
jgi:exosome complex component RRP42